MDNVYTMLFLYGVFVVAPIVLWFYFFRWKDRGEPEPKKMLFWIFVLGMGSAFASVFLESFFDRVFFGRDIFSEDMAFDRKEVLSFSLIASYVVASAIEEIVKFYFLKSAIYHSKNFTQIIDGVVYGISLALGFSFVENSGYFYAILSSDYPAMERVSAVFLRALLPLLLHITATGICGYYLGKKKFTEKHSSLWLWKGLFLAILLHSVFNVSLVFESSSGFLVSICVLIMFLLFLLRKVSLPESKMVWKLVYRK